MTKRLIAGTALLTLLFVIWLVFIANNTRPDEVVFDLVAPYTNGERTDWMKKISFLGNHQFLIPCQSFTDRFFYFRKKT